MTSQENRKKNHLIWSYNEGEKLITKLNYRLKEQKLLCLYRLVAWPHEQQV
jgi:hypothetical protein